jgi:hypothetical protein
LIAAHDKSSRSAFLGEHDILFAAQGMIFFVNTWGDKTPVDFCPLIVSRFWGQIKQRLVCEMLLQ